MSEVSVALQPADADSLSYVERLLERNDLPVADVRDRPECFYVATRHGERVGIGGLERHGEAALLRSLVVEQSVRATGVGTAVCDALEDIARSADVETLYLLTTTADDFFAARGYETVERAAVPRAIRETTEFSDLCPTSAVCMSKSLS